MDPCLRLMLNSTVTVRSVTEISEGGSEVLGAPRVLAAYVERRTEIKTGGPGGSTERQTRHLIVTEEPITADDRVWLEGADVSNPVFSRRPEGVVVYKNPATRAIDHYEATL